MALPATRDINQSQAFIDLKADFAAKFGNLENRFHSTTVRSFGLFIDAVNMNIEEGVDLVITTGYNSRGVGSAQYMYDPSVNLAYVAANQTTSFISKNGRGFKLVNKLRGNVVKNPSDLSNINAVEGDTYYITAPGYEGYYTFTLGDFTQHTSNTYDRYRGIYQPSTLVPVATACWVRVPLPGNRYLTSWFGLVPGMAAVDQVSRLFYALWGIYLRYKDVGIKGTLVFGDGIYDFDDCITIPVDVNIEGSGRRGGTTIRTSINRGWLYVGGDHKDTTISGFSFITTGVVSPRVGGSPLAIIRGDGAGDINLTLRDLYFDVPQSSTDAMFFKVAAPSTANPKAGLNLKVRNVHVKASGDMGLEVIFHNGTVYGDRVFVDVDGCSFNDPGANGYSNRIALSLSGSFYKRVHNTSFERTLPGSQGGGSLVGIELVSGGVCDVDSLTFKGIWSSYISNSYGDGFFMTGKIRGVTNEAVGGAGSLYLSCCKHLMVSDVKLNGASFIYLQDNGVDIHFSGIRIDSTTTSAFVGQNAKNVTITGSYFRGVGTNGLSSIVSFYSSGGGTATGNIIHGCVITKPVGAAAPYLPGTGLPGANMPVLYSAGGNLLLEQ